MKARSENRKLVGSLARLSLEQVLQGSAEGFIALDAAFRITFANMSATRLLGVTEGQLLGIKLGQVLPDFDTRDVIELLSRGGEFAAECSVANWGDAKTQHVRVVPLAAGYGLWLRPANPPARKMFAMPSTEFVEHRDLSALRAAERALHENENRHAIAIEAAHLGTWTWDVLNNDLHWSGRCRALYGVGPNDPITVESYRSRIHPGDRDKAQRSVDDCLSHPGELIEVEYRVCWDDGSVHWLQSWKQSRLGRDGRTELVTGAVANIDQRKAIEEELHRTTGALAAIIDGSPIAIVATDAAGDVTIWNPAAERTLGIKREEIIGRASPLHFESGLTYHDRECRVNRGDGREIEILCSVAPIDGSDPAAGSIAMFRDITERRRLRRHAEQIQKMESLGVLAGGVAHDFNNLLTGILGNASLCLYSAGPDSEIYSMLQEILGAGERAAILTRQLLAYAGKGRFVATSLSLNNLVRDTATSSQLPKPNGPVAIELDLGADVPMIDGDAGQLRQVILGLLTNAAEAMAGTPRGTVLIRTSTRMIEEGEVLLGDVGESLRACRYAVIEVEDSGVGIEPDTLPRIFEPFFSTKFTGRGLGLSAILGIVRQHRGTIQVTSAPGQGSKFRVLIPVVRQRVEAAAHDRPSKALKGAGRILVVDDEETVRTAIRRSLEHWGYDVILAENGQAAVEVFPNVAGQLRAVFLDLTMPVMGGAEAMRHMRNIKPEVPVILISGYSQTDTMSRMKEGTPSSFLQKPFTPEQLGIKLCEVLQNNECGHPSLS